MVQTWLTTTVGHKDTFANLWVVVIVKKTNKLGAQGDWVGSQPSPGRLLELYTDESVAFLAALDAIQPRFPREDLFHKKTKQNFYSSFFFSNVRTTPSHMKNIALADLLNEDILAP